MFKLSIVPQNELKNKISQTYREDEEKCVKNLLNMVTLNCEQENEIKNLATDLVMKVRNSRIKGNSVDAIMQEFKLSSNEGVALMCLAESLLRIPDKNTQDLLIRDKVTKGKWSEHIKSGNLFVNAASWGLMVTGKLVASYNSDGLGSSLVNLLAKGGEPLIRKAMSVAVRLMGNQFVMGETIDIALENSKAKEQAGYQFSYDMLGEAATTKEDASKYMQSYINAIKQVGIASNGRGVYNGPGISVKLSAIHPRYQRMKYELVMTELYASLKELYLLAQTYQIGLFIDAEESERLEISLDLLKKLLNDNDLAGFNGIGFVIQAYQKRAPYVIDYVADLAKSSKHRIMIRLVKGAYWDSEIKKAQIDGQIDYPVYTRKAYTDLSYLACADKLLNLQQVIYPLFATHNAYSLAAIYVIGADKKYEFQCLYGMGETLYDNVVGETNLNVSCRVYAPVGTYETLLAYLVRRLLENGANSSFVHQLVDKNIPVSDLVKNPIEQAKQIGGKSNPHFTKPAFIYPDGRINSRGMDLSNELTLKLIEIELTHFSVLQYNRVRPLVANLTLLGDRDPVDVKNPANRNDIVGSVVKSILSDVEIAVTGALDGLKNWSTLDVKSRANCLLKMADLLEDNYTEVMSLLVREAGKTLNNAISEIREAIDFCRYYANQAINELDNAKNKPLGVIICISPWNFPLAIFLGEISSALVTGNSVIAKPSDQTNLIAAYAVKLFYKAGVPENVLQFMPGSGSIIGDALTKHTKVAGVIFTGSTEVAQQINRNLATKSYESVLIAETGGQNTMIVDSTALSEQVVSDVITSGFDSSGQRCSALRVLYLQADIADKIIHMLTGAMDELYVGNPCLLGTDVGPVIDARAQAGLLAHIEKMKKQARMFYQAKLSNDCKHGTYVAPTLVEIGSIKELDHEVFGPVVHIIRFDANKLDAVIDEINSTGYGLTQGLHSRIEETAQKVYKNIKAGNIYINRNMVGAVVGVQPFGGERLSGTGPKAGGPLYIYRLLNTIKPADSGGIGTLMPLFPRPFEISNSVKLAKLERFINGVFKFGFDNMQICELKFITENCRLASPEGQQIELPGPTGERNFMFFAGRGYVACFAGSKFETVKQIIHALSCDNDVILIKNSDNEIFAKYLPKSSYLTTYPVQALELNTALIAHDYLDTAKLKEDLAKRDGVIVNVIMQQNKIYDTHLLITERTVSINTTATGGNVQLMSIKDNIEEKTND